MHWLTFFLPYLLTMCLTYFLMEPLRTITIGQQVIVYNFFNYIHPYFLTSFPITFALPALAWCFPLGFHPLLSHLCLLVFSHSGVGAFLWDFKPSSCTRCLCFWLPPPEGLWMVLFLALLHVVGKVWMMNDMIWSLWP